MHQRKQTTRNREAPRNWWPTRRVLTAAIVLVASIGLLTGVTLLPTSRANYGATTGNGANNLTTDSLASPTSLSATQRCPVPSVIAAVSAGESGGTVALVVPAAAAAGDLLIAHLANDNTSTPPSGWSLLNQIDAGGNLQGTLYQRIATAGDPNQTYSFTLSGSKGAGAMLVVRDAAGLVATGDAAGLDTGASASVVAPSVTTTASNSLLISFFGLKKGGESFSTPSGMTETHDYGGVDISVAADYELRASAGATGSRTATATAIAAGVGHSIAIARADRPEVDLSWTPTSSAWATGHEITRNATVVASVAPRTTSTWTDTSPGSGSTTFQVRSAIGLWRSAPASTTLTVGCS